MSSQSPVSPSDAELLHNIARQSQQALSQLYDRYGDLVFSFALRVLGDTGLAEEVTQDVFIKIWSEPKRWKPELGRFSSWLLTVTRYTAIDRWRKERRRPETIAISSDGSQDGPNAHHLTHDPEWQDGQWLQKLLQQLPVEQAKVIELGFFQGMTHSQIAQTLNLPLGTVKSRARLGLLKLKSLWLELAP